MLQPEVNLQVDDPKIKNNVRNQRISQLQQVVQLFLKNMNDMCLDKILGLDLLNYLAK